MTMELAQVRQAIQNTRKGTNVIVEWTRPCDTRKGTATVITKAVRMVCRMGIEYDNINNVIEKREEGTLPAVNAGLKWGTWFEYPYLISHKGKMYLRLSPGTSSLNSSSATFFMDGVETTKGTVIPYLLAKELKEKEDMDCFCLDINNITRLHNEGVEANIPQQKDFPQKVPALSMI